MYADDVITFVRPNPLDLHTRAPIVADFGGASGLCTNLAKCSIHPVRCTPEQVELARGILGCTVGSFSCKYLGLPLGLHKPTPTQLQYIVDNAANRMQPWCAGLMRQARHTTLVTTTLAAIPIHALLSLDVPA